MRYEDPSCEELEYHCEDSGGDDSVAADDYSEDSNADSPESDE